jgi:hypothetical protein
LRSINPVLISLSVIFLFIGSAASLFISFNDVYYKATWAIDKELASQFGTFFQGFVGTLFAAAGAFIIAATFYAQYYDKKRTQVESMFLKMIEFHRENVNTISVSDYRFSISNRKKIYETIEGKRAFVVFKLQLFDCIDLVKEINVKRHYNLSDEKIADIAYLSFYYGIDESWKDFVQKYLNEYNENIADYMLAGKKEIMQTKKKNVGRTNQTTLGTYYRNMYNAIKLVDESIYLSKKEKYSLIKIYRAQLSNSELALLFFNLLSSQSIKWKKHKIINPITKNEKWIDHDMINRYRLLKNVPEGYVHDYNRKLSFNMDYEDEELLRARMN